MNYTSIAYPTDELHIPDWFKELPFDEDAMEEAVLERNTTDVKSAETDNMTTPQLPENPFFRLQGFAQL